MLHSFFCGWKLKFVSDQRYGKFQREDEGDWLLRMVFVLVRASRQRSRMRYLILKANSRSHGSRVLGKLVSRKGIVHLANDFLLDKPIAPGPFLSIHLSNSHSLSLNGRHTYKTTLCGDCSLTFWSLNGGKFSPFCSSNLLSF